MKRIISILLVICLFCCLVGCGSEPVIQNPGDYGDIEVMDDEIIDLDIVEEVDPMDKVENIGFDNFDSSLINYVNNSEFQKENYCLSPLSIKLALALVSEGSKGETQEEILNVLGVTSVNELRDLSMRMNRIAMEITSNGEDKLALYRENPDMFSGEPPVSVLKVNNSIWKNANQYGTILDSYKINIQEYYNGTSENIEADLMEERINTWINENTRGMIPKIVSSDIKNSNVVLVNTLYLKDSWSDEFFEGATVEKDFTTITGEKVSKDFMRSQDDYLFYEDDNTKILVLKTQSDIYVAFVLGDNSNIEDKINKTTTEEVIVELPKLSIESSFEDKFLVDYLGSMGVDNIFDYTQADFSNMIEIPEGADNIYVDDIIHKTKLVTDEKGIEGAAATAVIFMCGAAMEEPKQPKEFIANEPFSFYVFTMDFKDDGSLDKDLLFYGQNVK